MEETPTSSQGDEKHSIDGENEEIRKEWWDERLGSISICGSVYTHPSPAKHCSKNITEQDLELFDGILGDSL